MGKKLNYDYVKNYIKEKSSGGCKLLSKEYINSTTPLTLECKCGNVFYSNFDKLKNSLMICKECRKNFFSKKYRLEFEKVKEYIKSKNCEYISGEYINNSSKLTLKCNCGNIFIKSFTHFKRGQNRCQTCGKENTRLSKIKYSKKEAIDILSKKDLSLIGDYIDSYHKINCICSKGHKFSTKLQFVLYNKFGCLECSKQYHIGENANHYKGGESEVLDRLRKITKQWKMDVAKKYNYKCFLTNSKNDCVVHHLIPFMSIVKKSCEELNLPLYKKIKDYNIEDFKKLEELVLEKHTLDIGVLLQRKIHQKFHSIYGMVNNTKEQFIEFSKKITQ